MDTELNYPDMEHPAEEVSPGGGAQSQGLDRLRLLVGDAGLDRLQRAKVAVFGLGAVGSFAVEALARTGVGHLVLVDHDVIKASNLNRQIFALTGTVGQPKALVAAQRVKEINPRCRVEPVVDFFCTEKADSMLGETIGHVVDAIDSLNPKVNLILSAHQRGINLVSAMGAANRTDPAQVSVGDISLTKGCPLARKVRRRLRRLGVQRGVTTVWSAEIPRFQPTASDSAEAVAEHDGQWRGRRRGVLPSMAPLPGIFGLAAANHIIWSILDSPEQ